MTSIKCDQPGCDYVATHKRSSYAKCLIGIHKRKRHGIKGKTYVPKAKRIPVTGNSTLAAPLATPNFCPNCGCHLRAVTAAMNLRRGA